VAVVSALSMWSWKVRLAEVAALGIVTVWARVSVVVFPLPASQAFFVPWKAGWVGQVPMAAVVPVQLADPFSNPPFRIFSVTVTGSVTVTVAVADLEVSATEVAVTV